MFSSHRFFTSGFGTFAPTGWVNERLARCDLQISDLVVAAGIPLFPFETLFQLGCVSSIGCVDEFGRGF
jgi:hypothetical protein